MKQTLMWARTAVVNRPTKSSETFKWLLCICVCWENYFSTSTRSMQLLSCDKINTNLSFCLHLQQLYNSIYDAKLFVSQMWMYNQIYVCMVSVVIFADACASRIKLQGDIYTQTLTLCFRVREVGLMLINCPTTWQIMQDSRTLVI